MAVVISDRLRDGGHRLLDTEPDEQLVRLAQTGHDGAFAAIVRRYERELKAQAQRLTSDGRGEDAVQQAFLNAYSALQSGREVRHLRGWLHQILRNEVTRGRRPLEAPLDAAVISHETLEDTVQRRATAHAALAQLSALPDRQRDALLGTAVFGLPRAHVARTMGLSEGAVRQLVHRARLRLRQAASALLPFPLVKLFGAARSGVDAAPDAALGVGTAASGGLAVKVGALLASGAVVTGVAVTQTLPARHRTAPPAHGARHPSAHTRAASHGASAPAPSVAVAVRAPTGRPGSRFDDGKGRLFDTRSSRGEGAGSGRGRTDDAGRGDNGSRRRQDGGSGRGRDGAGSVSGSGMGSGSRSGAGVSDGGSGSSRGGGAGSGSRDGGDSGSRSGATTSTAGSSGSGSEGSTTSSDGSSGSGSHDSGASQDGGLSSGSGDSSGVSSGAVGSDDLSSGGSGSDGGSGSGSGTDSSGGSRDVSGSLDSSSS
jgi:RNA polymerase sigma factor (sigma-70 family)